MKPKPAFLLTVLVVSCAVFLNFLWNEGKFTKVCCQEKLENTRLNGENSDFTAETLTWLIAFSRSSY